MQAVLGRITIYPIKSLAGVEVRDAAVLPSGALANDRRFALVDADGRFVNGKRTASVHAIRAEYDLDAMLVRLGIYDENSRSEFSLLDDQRTLSRWFSEALHLSCELLENASTGFPDDSDAPGPTLVSAGTLKTVAGWFPGLAVEEVRRRFRANLEIDGVAPFWEDRLVGPPGTVVPFEIGGVRWLGVTACQRCVVPTRASDTGEAAPLFQKSFAANRQASLPPWAPRERFDHFYRLAVNSRLATGQSGGTLRVGDGVLIQSA